MSAAPILEIACFSLNSAIRAQSAGADRIELCENYAEGGITPSEALILKVKQQVQLPLQVMIRPRGGNFVYSESELLQMEASILMCKKIGVTGLVVGVLTPVNKIDVPACRRLAELAWPLPLTFHRAIDSCSDVKEALKELVASGFERVLSSGRGATALEGLAALRIMQKIFGRQICIMAGGGVRSGNLSELLASGCKEYHSSGITTGPDADPEEIKAMKVLLTSARAGL